MACNDPKTGELLATYELGLLGDDDRRRVERHLLVCADCLEELYETAPAADYIRRRPKDSTETPRRSPEPQLVGVGAGPHADQGHDRLRGAEEARLLLTEPIGEVGGVELLRWQSLPGAVSYLVRVETVAGDEVWEATVDRPPARLPALVAERLSEADYVWWVEARTASGERVRSQRLAFSVVRPGSP